MGESRFRIGFIITTEYYLLVIAILALFICPLPVLSEQIPQQDLDALQTQLEETGWKVQRSPSGDLLLFPRPDAAQASPPGEAQPSEAQPSPPGEAQPSSPGGSDVIVRPSELLRVRDILEQAGWRLEKENDGSILLFPQTSDKPEGVRRGESYVPGTVVSTLFRREIELPVDSWDEALRITNSWLADQPAKGLIVGKIRKINWIYLVSIVEDSAPYRLNNQLAIREKDGTVIPLH